MSERNNHCDVPLTGEVAGRLIVDGYFDELLKEHLWQVVSKGVPGYPRSAFDRHWLQYQLHRRRA